MLGSFSISCLSISGSSVGGGAWLPCLLIFTWYIGRLSRVEGLTFDKSLFSNSCNLIICCVFSTAVCSSWTFILFTLINSGFSSLYASSSGQRSFLLCLIEKGIVSLYEFIDIS